MINFKVLKGLNFPGRPISLRNNYTFTDFLYSTHPRLHIKSPFYIEIIENQDSLGASKIN